MTGQTISHYRILEKLGEGGMGVVYKAEDTKLERTVALKFLPAHLLGNAEVRKRFEREAKASAALSHPNVCRVYEIDEADGKTFLAMELVEGESLDKKIAKGPLKLDEAVSIAQQVAKGLEAAHKRGIVHRDIKPENIMIGEDGHVTIMDFGLAQLTEASRLTKTDETIGTVAYMSPEQTEGSGTDHRTDLWALGVVLYEMVTGQQPFKGDYDKAVMYSILNEAPEPITALRTAVPMELELLVNKCLVKKAGDRYGSAQEIETDLRALAARPSSRARSMAAVPAVSAAPAVQAARTLTLAWAIAALSLCAAAAVAYLHFTATVPIPQWRTSPLTAYGGEELSPALSPDGEQVAFIWNKDASSTYDVYVRLVDGGRPLQLTSTPEREGSIAWSPDSKTIAFTREDGVYAVPSLGGSERQIAPLQLTIESLVLAGFRGLDWSPDGRWLVALGGEGLQLVEFRTGRGAELTKTRNDRWPVFSPDGRTLAFVRGSSAFLGGIFTMPFDSSRGTAGEPQPITRATSWLRGLDWWPDGRHLIFSARVGQRELFFRAAASGRGEPEILPFESEVGSEPSVSVKSKRLAYARSTAQHGRLWKVPLDGAGRAQLLLRTTRSENESAVSPDGTRVVCISTETGFRELWRVNVDGSEPLQLTSAKVALLGSPTWSPDGAWIAFDAYFEGNSDVYRVRAEGGELVPVQTGPSSDSSPSYSSDGAWIYFSSNRESGGGIWRVGAAGGDPQQVISGGGGHKRPSADGRYLYFGRNREVWRRPLGQDITNASRDELVLSGAGNDWDIGPRNLYAALEAERRIVAVDLVTKRVREVMRFQEDWARPIGGPGVTVGPDERFLLLSMFEPAESDLILVEGLE